jgi:hypothetical protein
MATSIGSTVEITAAASGPNQPGVTYAWTDNSPSVGTLSAPVNNNGLSSRVTFTCDAPGTAGVTVAVADQGFGPLYCSDQSAAGDATCKLGASSAGTACGTEGTCVLVTCPETVTTQTVSFVCADADAGTGDESDR